MGLGIFQRLDVVIDLHRYHTGFFRDIAADHQYHAKFPDRVGKAQNCGRDKPGAGQGQDYGEKVSQGLARKVAATSSGLGPMAVKAFCKGCTTKGME